MASLAVIPKVPLFLSSLSTVIKPKNGKVLDIQEINPMKIQKEKEAELSKRNENISINS